MNYTEIVNKINDDKARKQKEIADELAKENKKLDNEFSEIIYKEYNISKRMIGEGLTINKEHEKYYSFSFCGVKNRFSGYLVTNRLSHDSAWKFSELSGHSAYQKRQVNLNELSSFLIDWITKNLTFEGTI